MTNTKSMNATEPVNAALNYGYGFLKVECRMAVNTVGLEPAIGFLHESSGYQTKESLVYDLEEPFRFLIDLTVIKAFESGWLSPEDFAFTRDDYLYRIENDGRKRLLHLLRERFNSGVQYKGRLLKWDTVIEQKTAELARYFVNQYPSLSFQEPKPVLERPDNIEMREKILSLTQVEAEKHGIGKSTLHYLRRNARDSRSFRIYSNVKEKIGIST
jgi:CRISPR-associated protein Cas1